jgi:alpha-mannosidase
MTQPVPGEATFYCIPHCHWEGAVFQTREQYLAMGLPFILHALQLLRTYPEYRYTIDQACYVRPFLERYPEEAAAFRQFVNEGRLAIVGGTDSMLDVNMPGGESFVRQVLYAKGYFRAALGIDVTTGWQLDTFGHHAQMPQLLKLAGFRTFWFFRGVASWEHPAEFLWEGLDGTRIPALWLAQGYCYLYGSPKTLSEFNAFVAQRYHGLDPQAGSADRVGVAAMDVEGPEDHLPGMMAQYNAQAEQPFRLRFAVPADYEDAVLTRDLPVSGGELNPIFQGIYSSRIELKQRTRELETLLTTAEALGALLRLQGKTVGGDLWDAWEPMLFNQAHDLMSGVMTDGVYEDTILSYDCSRRRAIAAVDDRLRAYCDAIDTRGEGTPLVVFNSLGHARMDLVEVTVGFGEPGVRGVALRDPDGEAVLVQILDAVRREDGTLISATLAFVADVPALGHAVYRVLPQAEATPESVAVDDAVLENVFYRVEIDAASGAITRLLVKDGDWDALRAPGNVVALEEDHGDLWEPYHPLDGGSRIAMTTPHPVSPAALLSAGQTGAPGRTTRGLVVSEFTVTHPLGQGRFSTTIRLYAGLRRIDIRTTIRNEDSRVRYRVLFPTTIAEGTSVHEIPYGAITRPAGIEFPAQNWADWSDGTHGVALLNRGLPGNNTVDGTLLLSLLRSASIVAYGFQGGYEEGAGSDTGLELGKTLTFDYALIPHAGAWQSAAPWRFGQAFNAPLLARTAAPHPGALPARAGLLEALPRNVAVSSLKVSEDGARAVLRLYETSGETAEVFVPMSGAVEVNLLEEPLAALDGAKVALRPYEIKTIAWALPEEEK